MGNTLHNVLAALVDTHGFSKTARMAPSGSEGNVVFLHLFIALTLQPCHGTAPEYAYLPGSPGSKNTKSSESTLSCQTWKRNTVFLGILTSGRGTQS